MNDQDLVMLKELCYHYKHLNISINLFTEILRCDWKDGRHNAFKPMTTCEVLKTGLYAELYGSKLWVNGLHGYQNESGGYLFRVSDQEVVDCKTKDGWSPFFLLRSASIVVEQEVVDGRFITRKYLLATE